MVLQAQELPALRLSCPELRVVRVNPPKGGVDKNGAPLLLATVQIKHGDVSVELCHAAVTSVVYIEAVDMKDCTRPGRVPCKWGKGRQSLQGAITK